MEAVRCPKSPERVGQLANPVHALIAEVRLERIGAVASELPTIDRRTHASSTPKAFAIRCSVPTVGS